MDGHTWLALEGEVRTGLGEGGFFTQLDWVLREFIDKLRFAPHPGTLNLAMTGADWDRARKRMTQSAGITITPPAGFCGAKCFPVRIADRIDGAAVLPEVDNYPEDKLEIIAPVSVREALSVGEGDRLKIELQPDPTFLPRRQMSANELHHLNMQQRRHK